MKPQYLNVPTSAHAIAKRCIADYYPKESVNAILKQCYCEKYHDDQNSKELRYVLIYPKGGDDWSLCQNRKTKKWSEDGHGTYFGAIKSKKEALKK